MACAVTVRDEASRTTLPTRERPGEAFADQRDENLSPMRCTAVLKKENALPRSELHFSLSNGHGFAGARQRHSDM